LPIIFKIDIGEEDASRKILEYETGLAEHA
jgi:hypothetical protein